MLYVFLKLKVAIQKKKKNKKKGNPVFFSVFPPGQEIKYKKVQILVYTLYMSVYFVKLLTHYIIS